MAQCLLDISDDSESKSLLDLQRYSLEMAGCFVCCWMTMAHKAAAAVTESLSVRDDLCPEGLPNNLYNDLLVTTNCACPQYSSLLLSDAYPVATTLLACMLCLQRPAQVLHPCLHTEQTAGQTTDRHTDRQTDRRIDTLLRHSSQIKRQNINDDSPDMLSFLMPALSCRLHCNTLKLRSKIFCT